MTIQREENRIVVQDTLKDGASWLLQDSLREAIYGNGYGQIVLDFSQCLNAYQMTMCGLAVQVRRLRLEGVEVGLVLPTDAKLNTLFRNANWAHLLDPDHFPASGFRDFRQMPATAFADLRDQLALTDQVIQLVMGAFKSVHRGDLAALEWSVNEIIDNVITHAKSSVGGIIQVSTFKTGKKIQFVVADAGIGIPESLHAATGGATDADVLARAIEEGITNGLGQGNGLFGSYQICSRSAGFFHIESGFGRLNFAPDLGLTVENSRVPYAGTLVAGTLDLARPKLLEEALQIKGRVYRPTDYVESRYEDPSADRLIVRLRDESPAFGTRPAGTPVRNRLLNLIQMAPGQLITIDFTGVPLLSSSFADEVFGKLFVEIGPLAFGNRLQLINVDSLTVSLIDKAIIQRTATGKR